MLYRYAGAVHWKCMCIFCRTILYTNIILTYCIHTILSVCVLSVHLFSEDVLVCYNYTTLYQHYTNILYSFYIWQCVLGVHFLVQWGYTCTCIFCITILYTKIILTYCIHTIFDSMLVCISCVQWGYTSLVYCVYFV